MTKIIIDSYDVAYLVAVGVPRHIVAKRFGISRATVDKFFNLHKKPRKDRK